MMKKIKTRFLVKLCLAACLSLSPITVYADVSLNATGHDWTTYSEKEKYELIELIFNTLVVGDRFQVDQGVNSVDNFYYELFQNNPENTIERTKYMILPCIKLVDNIINYSGDDLIKKWASTTTAKSVRATTVAKRYAPQPVSRHAPQNTYVIYDDITEDETESPISKMKFDKDIFSLSESGRTFLLIALTLALTAVIAVGVLIPLLLRKSMRK